MIETLEEGLSHVSGDRVQVRSIRAKELGKSTSFTIHRVDVQLESGDVLPVVFKDLSNGNIIITRSTMTSEQKIRLDDGNEYPLIKIDISSASHPFYTGKQKFVDTAGRVERFSKKFGGTYSFQKSAPAAPAAAGAKK